MLYLKSYISEVIVEGVSTTAYHHYPKLGINPYELPAVLHDQGTQGIQYSGVLYMRKFPYVEKNWKPE